MHIVSRIALSIRLPDLRNRASNCFDCSCRAPGQFGGFSRQMLPGGFRRGALEPDRDEMRFNRFTSVRVGTDGGQIGASVGMPEDGDPV